MNSAAPTVVALETNSAWILILAVSLVTFPVVLLLRRLIDRPGGVASGILLALPLVLPVVAGVAFHQAALPEVAILRPVGQSLVSGAGRGLFDLLVFTDEKGGILVPYALWGSPGPYLLLIGISVSSIMLLRRLLGAVSMRRLVKRCRPPDDPGLVSTVEHLSAEAGLRRAPELLLLPSGRSGAFVAAGRPYRLLISEDIIWGLSADELEGLLAHELAHVDSRDVGLVVVSGLLRDLVAWNPIGHLAYRKLTAEREFEADRRAAGMTGKPLAVASGLLKVYELARGAPPVGAAVPFVRRRARVSQRVNRLLALADHGMTVGRAGYAPYLVAAILVAALGIQVGARVGGQSDSAFAIVVGGPEISDVDVWESGGPQASTKGPTRASGEGRARPLEAQKRPLSLRDPRLTESVAVSVQDVPRWVRTMTRMAGRAGISEAAVRAELQQSWQATPVFPGSIGGGLSVYRMEHDLHDEVFGKALR